MTVARSSAAARPRQMLRLDKAGSIIAALLIGGFSQPFVHIRPNRIISGEPVGFLASLPDMAALSGAACLLLTAGIALFRTPPPVRLASGAVALAALASLIGTVPSYLLASDDDLARIAPAAGFWILALALAMLMADAVSKLSLGPRRRLALLAVILVALALVLGSGLWDGLSVLREYSVRGDTFWQEVRRHIALACGSLLAALVIGIPLGIACLRSPRLNGVALPSLNAIQTIPSIAMYGLLMVPLGMLAADFPALRRIGVSGIGAAPAFLALFFYSLLPVVANVVVGLRQVSPKVIEAADAMGMSRGQRLLMIEFPIALPVILAGIRIVLVQNIGMVTIAALIGGGGLGTFVFQGIGQAATDLVLLGAIPTIILAFVAASLLDILIGLAEGRAG